MYVVISLFRFVVFSFVNALVRSFAFVISLCLDFVNLFSAVRYFVRSLVRSLLFISTYRDTSIWLLLYCFRELVMSICRYVCMYVCMPIRISSVRYLVI